MAFTSLLSNASPGTSSTALQGATAERTLLVWHRGSATPVQVDLYVSAGAAEPTDERDWVLSKSITGRGAVTLNATGTNTWWKAKASAGTGVYAGVAS